MSLRSAVVGAILSQFMLAVALTSAKAQNHQNSPGMMRDERVQVAQEILDHIWTDEEMQAPQAISGYAEFLAYIDPVASAKFILDHPVSTDDGVLWYQNTRMILFSNPRSLPDELIIKLLDAQDTQYAFFLSTVRLAENLAKDRIALRSQIAETIRHKEFRITTQPFQAVSFQIRSYDAFELPQLADAKRKELHEFYASGEAERNFQKIEESPNSEFSKYEQIALRELAPEEFKSQFVDAPPRVVYMILADSALSDANKAIELRSSVKEALKGESYTMMALAQQVSQIAALDRDLATQLCDDLKSPFPRALARIHLAVALAKDDPADARQLMRHAYAEIEQQAKPRDELAFDYQSFASNYPMALIGAIGLRGVEMADPDYLPEAIKIVVEAAPALLDSTIGDAKGNYFEVVAAVARYDRERAKQLFKRAGDDVKLREAASYFVALAALDPESILDEYEFIPMKGDERGIRYRPYIRNALIPALCAEDDTRFWDALARHSGFSIQAVDGEK